MQSAPLIRSPGKTNLYSLISLVSRILQTNVGVHRDHVRWCRIWRQNLCAIQFSLKTRHVVAFLLSRRGTALENMLQSLEVCLRDVDAVFHLEGSNLNAKREARQWQVLASFALPLLIHAGNDAWTFSANAWGKARILTLY